MAQNTSIHRQLKINIKRFFCLIFYYSGVEWLLMKSIGSRKIAIITFHSINCNKYLSKQNNFSIPPEAFDAKISFLKRYNLISMDELIQYIYSATRPPKNSVVLTFDDGYQDNYLNAFPVLKKYNVPAIIYLTTDYIGGEKWLPLNTLYYLITLTSKKQISISHPDLEECYTLPLFSEKEKEKAKLLIAKLYKNTKVANRNVFMEKVLMALSGESCFEPQDDHLKMLNWKEIKEMLGSGLVTFGSHTKTHVILASACDEEVKDELKESKRIIEEKLKISVRHFCYPNGHKEDFISKHKDILHELGYDTASTTIDGTNDLTSQTDCFELKRIASELPNYIIALKILLKS